jgi:hypothetical protein
MYVLSFAAFKLSRNCMPLAVVVSTVSVFAFDSACAQGFRCQQACPSCPPCDRLCTGLHRRRWAWCCGDMEGPTEVSVGLLVEPSRRAPSRSHPHRDHRRSHASEPPPTMQSAHLGAAHTGTFWRFAGRPSPSATAAPAALRLLALSILAGIAVA